jgi:hypothetical protein
MDMVVTRQRGLLGWWNAIETGGLAGPDGTVEAGVFKVFKHVHTCSEMAE